MTMADSTRALLALYRDPSAAAGLTLLQWREVLAATRRSRTLGHLALRIEGAGVAGRLPARVAFHLDSMRVLLADRRRRIRWEISELAQAARGFDAPVLLLKGGAYEALALPLARGRAASDIDVLVPATTLAAFESRLRAGGWEPAELDEYDERYYRQWSHELPPFTHPERAIEVDVHHSITPAMRGGGIDTNALIDASRIVEWEGHRRLRVLAPEDQLIHCAIHTFKDSDLSLRLRETMDFDMLWRHHGASDPDGFARALVARAVELGQQRPMWWAIHFAHRWLGTPFPAAVLDGLSPPGPGATAVMDWLADRAMLPAERMERQGAARWAAVALLARYHYHRMPLRRLVPHLLEKSRRRMVIRERDEEPDGAQPPARG